MKDLYAERDIIEHEEFYTRHISAMTKEGLDSKSDIAAELAHRDITALYQKKQIERLYLKMEEYRKIKGYVDNYHDGNVTHAAKALGAAPSTLHRVMDSGYVIDGTLYTIKRKAS